MKLRYTKAERLRKSAAESVLSDPAATPTDRMAAVRCLERLESAARRRAEEREWNLPEPTPAPEPTVDEIVADLEAKKPLHNAPSDALQPVSVLPAPPDKLAQVQDIADGKMPPAVPVPPPAPVCALCAAKDDLQPAWNGELLCPPCLSKMCAAEMLKVTAKAAYRDVLAGYGEDPNTNDIGTLRGMSDYERSVQLWREQSREESDRAEQEAQERARAESAFHSARAEFLANGGRL